jgi:hypothetical protein
MRETWLRPNLRALRFGLLAPAVIAVASLALVLSQLTALIVAGWILLALALTLGLLFFWFMRRPVLAYEAGYMLVYLRKGGPFRMPIGVVEGFFLGSGPLKLADQWNAPYQTVNLIVRLAEKATEWADRPVKPALGRWAESYVMIHGAWCEPLSLEVVSRLNVRLHQIQQGDEACRCPSIPVDAGGCADESAETHGEKTP